MIESLYIAESGMTSQQQLIDVISNNIANVSTPGFKKTQLNFVDLVYQGQVSASPERQVTAPTINGAGVRVNSSVLDFSVGDLKPTGNPFDLAIQGKGFVPVTMEDGSQAYIRAARLRLDKDGFLVSQEGYRLSADIQLPPDASKMTISQQGEVNVLLGEDKRPVSLGNIELVSFSNNAALRSLGNNVFAASENSGEVIYGKPGEFGMGTVAQGVTELSNVSMTEEMVNLMLAQRGYQLNARIIQISDQLMDTVNNLRR